MEKNEKPIIALCIRGHLRTYLKTIKNIYENIIDDKNYKIIVFLHTWDTMDYNNNIEIPSSEKLTNLYKTNNILIENQKNVKNMEIMYKNKNRDKFKYQLYSIYKLKNMVREYEKNNNFIFDYYIHTRFDIYFNTTLTNIINIFGNNEIITDPNFTYYDLACILNNNTFNLYSDMILYPFGYYKNKYKMYGIIIMIDCLIKQKKLKHIGNRFSWIMR